MLHPLILTVIVLKISLASQDVTEKDGHLKPFGSERPYQLVEEVDAFPDPKSFHKKYVLGYKPVKMKNVAKISPAFTKWTDEYFMSLNEPRDHAVSVETRKKENRSQDVREMPFTDFVKSYNTTGIYMVNPVPPFIGNDIVLPCPLQCRDIVRDSLVENIMWFSSGGTKSVVHTDSVDNINCLYRGEKTFVMVDPEKYGDKVDIDHPEGAYSGVDVDSVDYTKYPGLAEVEYYLVNLTAGDCLYIPYKWIHQVRSFNSNIAVNIWWDHYKSKDVNWDDCNEVCDEYLTLTRIKFNGFSSSLENIEHIKDHFKGVLKNSKEMQVEEFLNAVMGNDIDYLKQENRYEDASSLGFELFSILDLDKDSLLTLDEVSLAPDETWTEAKEIMIELGHVIDGEDGEDKPHDEL